MGLKHKLFSLFLNGDVEISPGEKIVRKNSFSRALKAQEVLKSTLKDSEHFRIDVATECETLKEQAQREGFEAGFAAWAGKMQELEQKIEEVGKNLQEMVLPIALKAANKIVAKELQSHPDTIVSIVSSTIKSVAQHKRVTIWISGDDFEALEKERTHLQTLFENLESLSIRPREDIEAGGCIIETESGIINATLPNRWQILEQAFAKLHKLEGKEHA